MERRPGNLISRREVLKMLGGVIGWSFFPETKRVTPKETITALWDGRLNPTWIEISNFAVGQLQARNWDLTLGDWEPKSNPTFAWILNNNSQDFRGLIFIHRDNLLRAEESGHQIKKGTKIYLYANYNHDQPVLEARVGISACYKADRFNDSNDPLVQEVANSSKTIAIVTCDPPDSSGPDSPRRIVYYAWASVPFYPLTKNF